MNETEIRERVREALGDTSYPPDLPHRLTTFLAQPPRRSRSAIPGVIAAILALLLVATFVFVRIQSPSTPLPASPPGTSPGPRFPMLAYPAIPQADLDAADMSAAGDLVTPLNLSATRDGRTLTLLGAYADSSRTVLFLRSMPEPYVPHVTVYDDTGLLNASGTGARGIVGDSVDILHAGPRPGADGVAHLKVSIAIFDGSNPPTGKEGTWEFDFSLRVPASVHLRPAPPLTTVGPWTFTVETFEVTATEVHFQAVIAGASVNDIKPSTIAMTNTTNASLQLLTSNTTDAAPGRVRVDVTWRRPPTSDTYFLVVSGKDQGWVVIPGSVNPSYVMKGGPPLTPMDYPAASESISLTGVFPATITQGRPSQCGVGGGGDGTLLAFAMYFQVGGDWYWILLSTDPTVRQYTGPGTYDIRATIWPLGASEIFDGPVRLTVTSDKYPGPITGSVRGTLTWTGAATRPFTVDIAGSWTCNRGSELGPG